MAKDKRNVSGIITVRSKMSLLTMTLIIGFLLIFAAVGSAKDHDNSKELRIFTALLTGGQEVPDPDRPNNNSNAFGVAFMTLDEKTNMLCYSISFTNDKLVGTETAAHFHAPARPGENAPIVFDITPKVSPIGSPKNGCVGPLRKKQRDLLKNGLFYINIHSGSFPLGEIRGQVIPADDVNDNVHFKAKNDDSSGKKH